MDGVLDTARVKAFRVPAGTAVEVYATTLHYALQPAAFTSSTALSMSFSFSTVVLHS